MNQRASVAITLHPERSQAASVATQVVEWLESHDYGVRLLHDDAVELGLERLIVADGELGVGACLAVSLGGDGTMLRTFDLVVGHGVPVLGVNIGHLGYLTEFEPGDAVAAVEKALSGDLPVEERMMVATRIERADGTIDGPWPGLNEAVLEKKAQGHTVRLSVSLDGVQFATYAADGLIVSTPTGSTAYSLSARGAIVDPTHRALQLTPVAPHMLFDRSLLLRPDTTVRIEVVGNRAANLSVDGRSVTALGEGDALVTSEADMAAKLVTSGTRGFHEVLKIKFGLKDR
ncbi:MAG: NAD(+)/NADH kinase [Actinomycetota bacterium]|jgi:NAD+ kinase|nr:NAD(+)/NADH kinase [Actinomycetota bacterium]